MRFGDCLFDAGAQTLQKPEQEEGARDLQKHQGCAAFLAQQAGADEGQVFHSSSLMSLTPFR
jgi:hypothetical protein